MRLNSSNTKYKSVLMVHQICIILLSLLALNSIVFSVSESTRALKNKMVFKNPPIEKLNRTESQNWWGVTLFGNAVSVGYDG